MREDPDLTIVVVHKDDDHALALIAEAVETASGPVIAQLRGRDDVDFVARAAERGISAYVESNDPQQVQAVDRGHDPPLPRGRAAQREGRPARERARAARGDRARQGDPDGAPRHRRARPRSSACATTPARATAAWSTWPQAVVDGHALLPRAHRRPGLGAPGAAGTPAVMRAETEGTLVGRRARGPARAGCSRPATSSARSQRFQKDQVTDHAAGAHLLRAAVAVPRAAVRRRAAGLLRPAGR